MLRQQFLATVANVTPHERILSVSASTVPSLSSPMAQQEHCLPQSTLRKSTGKRGPLQVIHYLTILTFHTSVAKHGALLITSLKDQDAHHNIVPFMQIPLHLVLWPMENTRQMTSLLKNLWLKKLLSSGRLIYRLMKKSTNLLPLK